MNERVQRLLDEALSLSFAEQVELSAELLARQPDGDERVTAEPIDWDLVHARLGRRFEI